MRLYTLLFGASLLALSYSPFLVSAQSGSYAEIYRNLSGTWSTGSASVVTGIDFYNPVDRSFNIPDNTGTSYSFTRDRFWEQAIFLWQPNPTKPECPTAQLIWQHGTYEILANETMRLTPFWGDGHQYQASGCQEGVLTAYNQLEDLQLPLFDVGLHFGRSSHILTLAQPSGKRKNPLYKIYDDPPQMLPNEQLHVEVIGRP